MSAPAPFIDPRVNQDIRLVGLSKLDSDRLHQAFHDLSRLAAIEHAYMVGDDLDPLMAGVDPVETRDTAHHMQMLVVRRSLSYPESGSHSVKA